MNDWIIYRTGCRNVTQSEALCQQLLATTQKNHGKPSRVAISRRNTAHLHVVHCNCQTEYIIHCKSWWYMIHIRYHRAIHSKAKDNCDKPLGYFNKALNGVIYIASQKWWTLLTLDPLQKFCLLTLGYPCSFSWVAEINCKVQNVMASNMGFRYLYDTEKNKSLNLLNHMAPSKIHSFLISMELHIAVQVDPHIRGLPRPPQKFGNLKK